MRNLIIMAFMLVATTALIDPAQATADDSGQAAHRDHDPMEHLNTVHRQASGLACNVCHMCDEPTEAEPCLADCPRHGGHFYGDHDADEGPDVVVIDQLAENYRPVVFAHKLHAGMADMNGGCTNCHHYSETTGVIPSCRECHDPDQTKVDIHMPSLKGAYHRQCINCHMEWNHDNACEYCHLPAAGGELAALPDTTGIIGVPHPKIEATETYTYTTPYDKGPMVSFHHADHVDLFGLACVDCHQGNSCAKCHDIEAAQAQAPSTPLDHTSECCSCHAERDCGFCHDNQPRARFEHKLSTGFDLAPYHERHECATCHGDPKSFRTPSGHCDDCHIHWENGSFNHRVTGLELSEEHEDADCSDCHTDRNFEDAPTCVDCHDEELYPDMLPGDEVGR